MTSTPFESLRFFVSSDSGNNEYLVDLMEYRGNGRCDCAHYRYRIEPEVCRINPNDLVINSRYQCKHIAAARETFGRLCIARILELEQAAREKPVANSEYGARRMLFLNKHRVCAGCHTAASTEIHHHRGRLGVLKLDERFWVPICRKCHDRVGAEPEWARKQGLLCAVGKWNTFAEPSEPGLNFSLDTTKGLGKFPF